MPSNSFEQRYLDEVDQVKRWWSEPRWRRTKRRYSPHEVVSMRGSLEPRYLSNDMSKKLHAILERRFAHREASTTYGCLDPVMACQMSKHLDTIYVSGWQSAAMASSSDEPGPDYADYPYTTIPDKVNQLFKAQQFHDRKQRNARLSRPSSQRFANMNDDIDYLTPLIADADTGHGGLSATMKLTKLFIENGAACIHIEDQATGLKGGRGAILVPISEHIDRLVACRAQADICGVDLVLMCRTDTLRAAWITSVTDDRDHAFVLGATNPDAPSWADYSKSAKDDRQETSLADLEDQWIALAGVKTFDEAVTDAILGCSNPDTHADRTQQYLHGVKDVHSLTARRAVAHTILNQDICFDWDSPRHEKGYYRYRGGVACTIARATAYASYSDIIWPVFDPAPNLEAAISIAEGVHAVSLEIKLAANLPTPYDWAGNMARTELEAYSATLAKYGYCWQHMTIGGIHLAALAAEEFTLAFKSNPVAAFVDLIQEKEGLGRGPSRGISTLDSWNWAGGAYGHELLEMIKET